MSMRISPFTIVEEYTWSSCYEDIRKTFLNNTGLVLEILKKSKDSQEWDFENRKVAIITDGKEYADETGRYFQIFLKSTREGDFSILAVLSTIHEQEVNDNLFIVRCLKKTEVSNIKSIVTLRYLENIPRKLIGTLKLE